MCVCKHEVFAKFEYLILAILNILEFLFSGVDYQVSRRVVALATEHLFGALAPIRW